MQVVNMRTAWSAGARGRVVLWLWMGLMLVVMAGVLQACPTCKDGMAQDPARMNMVRGYFWSILFMMSMPFVIFSSLGWYFYREMKRLQAANARAAVGTVPQGVGN
jgi:uncharacterized membrane protein